MVQGELRRELTDRPALRLHEGPIGASLLDRPEILPQAVLDELDGKQLTSIDLSLDHDRAQRSQPCHPGGPPSPLTADDQISPLLFIPAHPDRLELAFGPERFGEPLQALLLELLPGLVRVPVDFLHGDLHRALHLGNALEPGRGSGEGWGRSGGRGYPTLEPCPSHRLGDVRAGPSHHRFEPAHHAASVSADPTPARSRAWISSARARTALAAAPRGLCCATVFRKAIASG